MITVIPITAIYSLPDSIHVIPMLHTNTVMFSHVDLIMYFYCFTDLSLLFGSIVYSESSWDRVVRWCTVLYTWDCMQDGQIG